MRPVYDFSTFYTTYPHNLIKDKLIDLIERTFNREGHSYLACNDRNAFLLRKKNLKNIMHGLVKMYEGCSNMNASSFITSFTYLLRQNGKRFFKGKYVTFKLAPGLKKNTEYLLSYSPLNEGYVSILTNSMLRTYTSDRDECIIHRLTDEIS